MKRQARLTGIDAGPHRAAQKPARPRFNAEPAVRRFGARGFARVTHRGPPPGGSALRSVYSGGRYARVQGRRGAAVLRSGTRAALTPGQVSVAPLGGCTCRQPGRVRRRAYRHWPGGVDADENSVPAWLQRSPGARSAPETNRHRSRAPSRRAGAADPGRPGQRIYGICGLDSPVYWKMNSPVPTHDSP